MFKYFIAALLVVAAPSIASANGGGSSKSTGSVRVTNSSSSLVALVAINPSSSLRNASSLSEFTSRGGKVINPGGRHTFSNVKVGNQSLVYALVASDASSVDADDFSSLTVKVNKGKQTQVSLPPPSPSSTATSN